MENNEERTKNEILDRLEMKWNLRYAFKEMTPDQQRDKVMKFIAQKPRMKMYRVEFDNNMEDNVGICLTDEEAEYIKSRLTELYKEKEMGEDDYADGVFCFLSQFRGCDKRIDELVFDVCDEAEVGLGDEYAAEPVTLYLDHYTYCPKFTVVPIFPKVKEPYEYRIGLSDEDYATLLMERIKDDLCNYNWLVMKKPELAAKLTDAVCFPSVAHPSVIDYRRSGDNTSFIILFDEVEEDFAAIAEWWKK